jgi:tagaturonate reductase
LGYVDDLITMSEVYSLWAIEGDASIAAVLSFAAADKGVVITPDITVFKELKLRMLNGTHSLTCAVAFLSGIVSVKEAMDNPVVSKFVKKLMTNEIARAVPYDLPLEDALTFAGKVLDRFRNPSIEHHWINISLNYTSKLEMRIAQVLVRYVELYKSVPENMALGFAAYLVFMKAVKLEADVYYGNFNGTEYPIKDPKAGYFFEQWKNYPVAQLVKNVLSDSSLWNADLSALPGFAEKVTENVEEILKHGMTEVLRGAVVATN